MYLSNRSKKASATLLVLLFTIGLVAGGLAVFYVSYRMINNLNSQVSDLQDQISTLQTQVAGLSGSQNVNSTNQTITIIQNGTDLANLYANVSRSIVMVHSTTSTDAVQGSGFVCESSGRTVVVTNFHVVYDTTTVTVIFSNGHAYSASVLGHDAYADLAVLSVDAPSSEFKPLEIVSSSGLRVGDQVIAIGNPYGLVGSLTTGIVSALGRSITEQDYTSNFAIANIIQTSTPINPGNSGGPLLNAVGQVVGITTAIVSDSQGLGFAVPSSTILRELPSLITTGSYTAHPYLGVYGNDMTYAQAQQMGVDVTYGWLISSTVTGGPSDGQLQSGDIIIALNGSAVRNNDDLASYLEGNALPGDVVRVTLVRGGSETNVNVTLGTRPAPPV